MTSAFTVVVRVQWPSSLDLFPAKPRAPRFLALRRTHCADTLPLTALDAFADVKCVCADRALLLASRTASSLCS